MKSSIVDLNRMLLHFHFLIASRLFYVIVGQFTIPRGPTKRILTAANGAFLGAKLACFWPSGLPKWPKIGLTCMILVRLTPVGFFGGVLYIPGAPRGAVRLFSQ